MELGLAEQGCRAYSLTPSISSINLSAKTTHDLVALVGCTAAATHAHSWRAHGRQAGRLSRLAAPLPDSRRAVGP